MQQQINLSTDFIPFLKGLIKINDSAILSLSGSGDDKILTCFIGTPNNVVVSYGTFPCTANFSDSHINVPSLGKLLKALEQIDSDGPMTLNVNSNNIEYKSPSLRFKYHLLENGIINQPAINIRKVIDYEYDIRFGLSPVKLSHITKFSSFSTDSNKIYLAGDGRAVFAELTDKARDNVDSFTFELTDYDKPFEAIPLSVDFFRGLSFTPTSTAYVMCNTSTGIMTIDIDNITHKFKYITTAYIS